jgi:hypothetical protein
MYANATFLLGMWERAVRDWIGVQGTIRAIRGFRVGAFNYVGDTTTVRGRVRSVGGPPPLITLEVWSENSGGTTVGPGLVEVTLPSRATG